MEVDFYYVVACQCGAITITTTEGSYSMSAKTFLEQYGFEIQNIPYSNCDHCVNHWGIDLCACGSGLPVGECDEGHDVCGTPAQDINKGILKPSGGWLP